MSVFSSFIISVRLISRAKLFGVAVGLVCVVALVMLVAAYFGGRQPVTVSLDVGLSAVRLLLSLYVVLVVQDIFFREFDRRYCFASFAYPHGRLSFLLGRFFALAFALFFLMLMLGLLQIFLIGFVMEGYQQSVSVSLGGPYLVVMLFMALDLLVLAALATLLAILATTQSFVLLGALGFVMVARSYGAIVVLLSNNSGVVTNAENYRTSIGVLAYVLPDLGALDLRMLALYGKLEFLPHDWLWLVISSLGYALGLLSLALWALQRKRFG